MRARFGAQVVQVVHSAINDQSVRSLMVTLRLAVKLATQQNANSSFARSSGKSNRGRRRRRSEQALISMAFKGQGERRRTHRLYTQPARRSRRKTTAQPVMVTATAKG